MKVMRLAAVAVLLCFAITAPASAQREPSAAPTERMEAPSAVPTIGVETVQTAGSTTPASLSMTSLIFRADPIMQAVLLFVVGSSLWSWDVNINKRNTLRRHKKKATK